MPKHHLHVDPEQTPSRFQFPVPQSLLEILQRLQSHGYRVIIVGGALRDFLLGHKLNDGLDDELVQSSPNIDYDLASDALPKALQKLFPRCLPTGIQHGTVTIMRGKTGYETTTFRSDGIYKDGRRPEQVSFTGNLETDLQRRDFSINAIAFEPDPITMTMTLAPPYKQSKAEASQPNEPKNGPKNGPKQANLHKIPGILHDLHNGQNDLKQGQIRAIGVARKRFEEDALRMLRACRFSAKLGFRIEAQTLQAIYELHANLHKVSKPRIHSELSKLLSAPHAALGLHYLSESGLWPEIFVLPVPKNWAGIDACFQHEQYALLRSLQRVSSQETRQETKIANQSESLLGELLRCLESSQENCLENSSARAFLRWDSQTVPQVGFAWALLHLSFSWPPERLPRGCAETDKASELQTSVQASLQTGLPNNLQRSLQKSIQATSQNKKAHSDWPAWHYALRGLEDLPFSKRERSAALSLLRWKNLVWGHDFLTAYAQAEQPEVLLRHWLALYGPDFSLPALCLLALSLEATNSETQSLEKTSEKALWSKMIQDLVRVLEQNPALCLQDLAINGKILAQECGIPAGPHVAKILQELLALVLREPQQNRLEILKQDAKAIYAELLNAGDSAKNI